MNLFIFKIGSHWTVRKNICDIVIAARIITTFL